MADAPGDDVAVMLLRVLPAEVAEVILGQMDAGTGARLRTRLRAAPVEPPPAAELDQALAQFFDLRRIAQRPRPAPPANPTEQMQPADPVDEVRALPPERLARALEGESPGAITLILSCLDPTAVGSVLRRLPAEGRAEIALRLTRPGGRNLALLKPLAKAVAEKSRRLADVPPEPSQDELITRLADMLRTFPRAERMPVVQRLEDSDPELASRVVEQLYRIEDILRIPDRQVQLLLGKLDVKTVAVALKGADPAIRQKVTANMSSRSKTVLEEESELLGAIPDAVVRESLSTVLAAIRKGEEDGQITLA